MLNQSLQKKWPPRHFINLPICLTYKDLICYIEPYNAGSQINSFSFENKTKKAKKGQKKAKKAKETKKSKTIVDC